MEKNKDMKTVYFHEKDFGTIYTPNKRYLFFEKKKKNVSGTIMKIEIIIF